MSDLFNNRSRSGLGIAQLFGRRAHAAGGGAPHLVVCGFGRLGKAVAAASSTSSPSRISVIERDQDVAELARRRGFHVVCGDADESHIQRIARVGAATNIAVCIDPPVAEDIVRIARALAPWAHIQVGISEPIRVAELHQAGADNIIVVSDIAGKLLAGSILSL